MFLNQKKKSLPVHDHEIVAQGTDIPSNTKHTNFSRLTNIGQKSAFQKLMALLQLIKISIAKCHSRT